MKVDPWRVIWQVELHFDITLGDLWKQDRSQPLALRRMICYYLLRRRSGLTYPEIGKLMHRHHSTVIHGVQRVEWWISPWSVLDPAIAEDVADITAAIREAA